MTARLPGDVEIVVVDDGHDAATRRVVEDLAATPREGRLRCLPDTRGRGPAAVRDALGGAGEAEHHALPGLMAVHRFFLNPIRYTSLGLAVVEAMFAGMPIVGLATTGLATVVANGRNGYVDTRPDHLADVMRELLRDRAPAAACGTEARRTAEERFSIGRFVGDWSAAFDLVAG